MSIIIFYNQQQSNIMKSNSNYSGGGTTDNTNNSNNNNNNNNNNNGENAQAPVMDAVGDQNLIVLIAIVAIIAWMNEYLKARVCGCQY